MEMGGVRNRNMHGQHTACTKGCGGGGVEREDRAQPVHGRRRGRKGARRESWNAAAVATTGPAAGCEGSRLLLEEGLLHASVMLS